MRPAKDASTTPNRGTVQTAKISNIRHLQYTAVLDTKFQLKLSKYGLE